MDNAEIARRLLELGTLLDISGANPFRVRAYRNASERIEDLSQPLAQMLDQGEDLTLLPGIGSEMAGHIRELVETGQLALFETLAQEVPRDLLQLTQIEGLGPKKVHRLWTELGVDSLDALERALRTGQVAELSGFGARSAGKLLEALERHRVHVGRFLRHSVIQTLDPLLEHLSLEPSLVQLEVAGSFRRGRETVGDIDLLATVQGESAPLMARFAGHPAVARVEMAGPTRSTVVLHSGLSVDLRVVSPESYGAALHYFTGSKAHNVEIRKRAQDRGLRISEYGIFREGAEGEERLGGATEAEVFEAVGLPWIPPVLRENRGEFAAAEAGKLPRLIQRSDLRGDLHMHTPWSDGRDSIQAMAEACRARGYAYLAISDHSQAVTIARGLTPARLLEQKEEIERVRERVDGIRIYHSCEVDILKDGTLDLPDEILEQLDLVAVAVHSHMDLGEAAMTRRIVAALEHPRVDILVHPTGRLLNRRDPYPLDLEAVFQAALARDVAVELNANPLRLDLNDRHLSRARELGVRVVISTDAHRTEHLDFMEAGILQAQRGWLEPRHVVNTLPLPLFERWRLRERG
jgi:DNA polymerase (family X)